MKIERLVRGELCANGYIIYDEKTLTAYVMDPGYDPQAFVDKLKELKLEAKGILLTHHHYDHSDAAEELKGMLNVPILIHEADQKMLKFKADQLLKEGDVISFGETKLRLVNTPGHTKGSSCFLNEEEKIAFTGDTIFNLDIGRTDLSDGDPYEMLDTMTKIISKWDDDWVIYPGHGDPATMAFVREHNLEYIEAQAIAEKI